MESPCVNICVIDDRSGYCIGCGRTRDEVANWVRMTPTERRATMDGLSERMASITRDRKRTGRRRERA